MMKIRNLEESRLMDQIFNQLFIEPNYEHIPHVLNIERKYFESLIERIIDYNKSQNKIFKLREAPDYRSFIKIHESDEFTKDGGFEKIYTGNTYRKSKI